MPYGIDSYIVQDALMQWLKLNFMLDNIYLFGPNVHHEQAPGRNPRPNPLNALRRQQHAIDNPRYRGLDQHGFQAAD